MNKPKTLKESHQSAYIHSHKNCNPYNYNGFTNSSSLLWKHQIVHFNHQNLTPNKNK
jgi:hypothetical protein